MQLWMFWLLYDKHINTSQYEKWIWLVRQWHHSLRIFKPVKISPTYSYCMQTFYLLPLRNSSIHLLPLWIYSFPVCYLLPLGHTFNFFKYYFSLKHKQTTIFNQNNIDELGMNWHTYRSTHITYKLYINILTLRENNTNKLY